MSEHREANAARRLAVGTRLVAFIVVFAMAVLATAGVGDGDEASSVRVARAYIPDDTTRLGEVRVLRRDDGLLIRTLLYSNLLKRIVAEIESKSDEGWPEGSRYRAESRRYVASLALAREEVWSRWRNLPNRARSEATQSLTIDFVVTSMRADIEIGVPTLARAGGEYTVVKIEPFDGTPYPAEFVRAEAARILEDRFPQRAKELSALLPAAPVE